MGACTERHSQQQTDGTRAKGPRGADRALRPVAFKCVGDARRLELDAPPAPARGRDRVREAAGVPRVRGVGRPPHAHPDETPADVRKSLRKALADFSAVSIHGPLGNASLASINPGIWRESLRQHLAAVEIASDIGATVLVTHPGDLRDHRFADEFTRLSREALAQLAERGAQLGVTIAVENCGPYHAGIDRTAADLAAL